MWRRRSGGSSIVDGFSRRVYELVRFSSSSSPLPPLGGDDGNQPLPSRRVTEEELRAAHKNGPMMPLSRIRNFSIIAHIDHGKTTLSDALLKRTGVVTASEMRGVGTSAIYMDKLEVERNRGITIKAQTATMFVTHPDTREEYMLNLIDTPGHIDFAFEVQRSLAACEGAVLLVDATQGVQAQTMNNFHLALERDVAIIPAMSKCDAVLNESQLDDTALALEDATGFLADELVRTSARAQRGLETLLRRIIDVVPAPSGVADGGDAPFRALLFDAWFGPHRRRLDHVCNLVYKTVDTVVCSIRVVDGAVRRGDIVQLFHDQTRKEYRVLDVGIYHPEALQTDVLYAGMVGYVDLGMETRRDAPTGDTLCLAGAAVRKAVRPVAAFKGQRPVLFSSFYPNEGESVSRLQAAVERLCINDPAVTMRPTKCEAFGPGLQLGFCGTLHQSVFEDRLAAEHDLDVLVTPSQVFYKYRDKRGGLHDLTVASWLPKGGDVDAYLEPVVNATVVVREASFNDVLSEVVGHFRGEMTDSQDLDGGRKAMKFRLPLAELIRGLQSRLMVLTRGFATLEYDEPVYEEADLVKIDVQVNKKTLPALGTISLRQHADSVARRTVVALRENIKVINIALPIQATIGGKVVARETVGARKKDVLAKIHAGDYSRKQKKLDDQKKGKRKAAQRLIGQFSLDSETMAAVMGATSL